MTARTGRAAKRAITFDLWNTLIQDESADERNASRLAAIQALLAAEGAALPVGEIHAIFEEAAGLLWADGVYEDVGPPGQAKEFLKRCPAGRIPEDAHRSLAERIAVELGEAILRYPPAVLPGVVDVVRALSRRAPVGLVSNTGYSPGRALRPVLADLGILPHLQALAFSDEVGWRKPDARIFLRTLDALEIEPSAAIHVGDHLHADVRGAKALGMAALWLAPATAETEAALASVPAHLRPDFVAPSVAAAGPVLDAWLTGTI